MRGNVLIVDDNARCRVRARRALEDDGYVVVGHDVADFGDRVARCGVSGFVPKAGLSGASLAAALSDRT